MIDKLAITTNITKSCSGSDDSLRDDPCDEDGDDNDDDGDGGEGEDWRRVR